MVWNKSFRQSFVVQFLAVVVFLAGPVWGQQALYWVTGDYRIQRSNLDGTNVVTLMTGGDPYDLAIDSVNNKIYWTDAYSGIYRMNLDGTGLEFVVGASTARGIALDVQNQKMYWTDIGNDNIKWAYMDGTHATPMTNGVHDALSCSLDLENNRIYWTEEYTGKVCYSNLNSTISTIATDSPYMTGIDVDSVNKQLYWVSGGYNNSRISRSNLDGSDAQDIISGKYFNDVLIDPYHNLIYWSGDASDAISCANLDGSNSQLLVSLPDLTVVRNIAIGPIPEPATMALLFVGGLAIARRRSTRA